MFDYIFFEKLTLPCPSRWAIILAAVLGVALLVVIVIVVLIAWRRHRNHSASSALYVPLTSTSFSSSSATWNSSSTNDSSSSSSSSSGDITCRLISNVAPNAAEHVIGGQAGELVTASAADVAGKSDWIWVRLGAHEGYVPRIYCVVVE